MPTDEAFAGDAHVEIDLLPNLTLLRAHILEHHEVHVLLLALTMS